MPGKKKKHQLEADLNLSIDNQKVTIHLAVDEGPTGPATILPFVQELSNRSIAIAVENTVQQGQSISCQKGCGACCAQLVPVTETEIRQIARLIKSLPKATRQKVMQRFDTARQKLETAGLWQKLSNPMSLDLHDSTEFGLQYFELGIACPFLEDGACSIHVDRPLACREYLVTSDAKHCADPRSGNIDGVNVPTRISEALAILCEDDPHYHSRWVPLIVAPYWQALFPDLPAKKTGPQWVELFLKKLNDVAQGEAESRQI